MNKIGLLTIHDTLNFGSQLQTYSLYKAVESLGWDIWLIDYKCKAIQERETTLPLKDAKSPKEVVKSLLLHGNLEKRKTNFHRFMDESMKLTEPFTRETIKKANTLFDTFLVGSDIVWGFNITGNDYTYMLDFAEREKRKVAFSSSVGTKWDQSEESHVKYCLSRFESISTREADAAQWVEELIGKPVGMTCDPTMLWNKNFWGSLTSKVEVPQEKYVLVYMSDTENHCIHDAIAYGKKHGMRVYYMNYRAPVRGTVDKRPTSLEEWISLIQNAEVIFSASYHGLLYAMYFEKKFYFYNWVNKSRMESLSKILHFEDRAGNEANIQRDKPVDYDIITPAIEQLRNDSWDRLRTILG